MKQITLHGNKQQKGFTLIEMSVVLVIIGVLIGGIVKGKQLIDDSNATAETQTLQLLVSNLHARYLNEANTATVSPTAAITSHIVPPGYNVVSPTVFTNSLGGNIGLVTAPDAAGTPQMGIAISMAQSYNFATCKKTANALKKSVYSMTIGATTMLPTATAPITADLIDTNCNTADTLGPIQMSFIIDKNS